MNLSEISIKRPIFLTSIVILLVAIGIVSFKSMPVEMFPEVNIPVVAVTIIYPGAGPSEIETLVTKPIEDELSTLSGMKRLTSKSLEGMSQVVAEFNQSVDAKYAEQQIRDKVSITKPKLPADIKEPSIKKMDPSDQPIMTFSLSSPLSDAESFDIADQIIKPRLEQVNNVGAIEIMGGRKREVHILLDRKLLKARELSVSQVAAQIGASGQNVPAGKVSSGDKETIFRSLGEYQSVDEINQTLVSLYANEVPTRVTNIGKAVDSLEDEKSRVFVNGTKSLFLDVYRQSGSNTLAVVKDVKKQFEKIQLELKEKNSQIEMKLIRDASTQIDNNVYDVYETIVIAIILTVITVFFFLGSMRTTFITGLSLPISLIGSFMVMYLAGFSINVVSLLALTLAIGLLVDDAIVVIENIYRRIETGESSMVAAERGTNEIMMAVVAITLVVISVFAPVGFLAGIVGQFLKQFGLTIAFSMAISFFVAVTVIPMLSAYFAGSGHDHSKAVKKGIYYYTLGAMLRAFDRFQTRLENGYVKVLHFTLKHPLLILSTSVAILIGSFVAASTLPSNFVPEPDEGELTVSLDLPPGTNLEAMNILSQQVDDKIRTMAPVALTALTVGSRNNEPNKANVFVSLKRGKAREGTTGQFKERLRQELKDFAHANPIVTEYDSSGGMQQQPVLLNLIGQDQAQLESYASKLFAYLKSNNLLKDADSTFRPGKPELQVEIKNAAAEVYGISTLTLGAELRAQIEGLTPAKYRENGREYDIRVRLLPEQRDLERDFKLTYVPNVNNKLVRLADVANSKSSTTAATIDRQSRGRYIQLSAGLAAGVGLNSALEDIKNAIATQDELKVPEGIRYAFAGESEDFSEMIASMIMAVCFSVLFIYLILASLYESFVTPLTILLALPLALAGAFLALYVTGESLNLFAFLGIFLLLGVSGKNSILLVDFARQLIAEGKSRSDALVEAGRVRLRPILMTSFALIAGTIPVAIGMSEASKTRTSMGIAIIGGLISSTILTLVVVPAAFSYIDRFRLWSKVKLAAIFLAKPKVVDEKARASLSEKVHSKKEVV